MAYPNADEIESWFEVIDWEHARFKGDDSVEMVAQGAHKYEDREIQFDYMKYTEGDERTLSCNVRYYLNGELKNERWADWKILAETVQGRGETPERFAKSNFDADPQVVVSEEFESFVHVA